jgi:glycosyl transferase family 25
MSALAIYCINLDKRTDRWQECLQNYAAMGLPIDLVQRWSAVEDAEFGALGCAKSHLAALADFMTRRTEPYCLVMEDDLDLLRPWNDFALQFNALQANGFDWDTLLLAGTCTLAYPATANGTARVLESQSASCYLMQRSYVPEIMHSFAYSVSKLELFRSYTPRDQWTLRFAIDQAWKNLQRVDRWYMVSPAMGHQRPSFSDIEKMDVDYSSLSWRDSPA